MYKKYLLPALNAFVQPWPYPVCLFYHLILGSTIVWVVRGQPRVYPPAQLLSGVLISAVVGAVLVVLVTELNKRSR